MSIRTRIRTQIVRCWRGLAAAAVLLLALRCQGGDQPRFADPVLASFTAERTVLSEGQSTSLKAVYSNGQAEVYALAADAAPGTPRSYLGPVPGSGIALPVTPAGTTLYTAVLSVVAGGVKKTVTSDPLTVRVVPLPATPEITVHADSVGPDQTCTASVPEQADSTYLWTVASHGGGTLTAGADTATVTFRTASFGKLVLRCTVTNAAGDEASAESQPLLLGGPTVLSFSAGTDSGQEGEQVAVTDGVPIRLDFHFSGGVGSIALAPAGGGDSVPVAAGLTQFQTTLATTPPTGSVSVYTLTVTDASFTPPRVSTQDLTVATVPTPTITRFAALPRPAILGPGMAAELLARFSAGAGATAQVDQDVGDIEDNLPVGAGTLERTTTFTLTVTNAEGLADPSAPAGRTTATATTEVLVGSLARFAGAASGQGSADGAQGRHVAPAGAALDADGNVYVADPDLHVIRRIAPDGVVWTVAGLEGVPGSADGLGAAARFDRPTGLALDPATGRLYVADSGNHAIRRVTVTPQGGQVTLFAGAPGEPGSADSTLPGSTAGARFQDPRGLAWGNGALYVADTGNHTIRQILADGTVATFSGVAGEPGNRSGAAVRTLPEGSDPTSFALFDGPSGVAWYNGSVYVADTHNNRIRVLNGNGRAEPDPALAINPDGLAGSANGGPGSARFNQPQGLAAGNDGRLFVADTGNDTLRVVNLVAGNLVSTLAGAAGEPGTADGIAARFDQPRGVAVNLANSLVVVADAGNSLVRAVPATAADLPSAVRTLSGQPPIRGHADGPALEARLRRPRGAALGSDGSLYLADSGNHAVRVVRTDTSDPDQPVTTVATLAGQAGESGFRDSADGAPLFDTPSGVAVAADGTVYVADTGNHAVRRVAPDGTVATVAGDGTPGSEDSTGAGPAGARFHGPMGVALAADGSLVVADTGNDTLRRIAPDGTVTTLAGAPEDPGAADGEGRAEARFDGPEAVAVAGDGRILVADTGNHLVRAFDPGSGQVTTVAGQAGVGGAQDGTGTDAVLDLPAALALDKDGNLFVANRGSSAVCTINPDGEVVHFLGDPAASGNPAVVRDLAGAAGAPLPAQLAPPRGLAVDADPDQASTRFIYVVVDDAVLVVDLRP